MSSRAVSAICLERGIFGAIARACQDSNLCAKMHLMKDSEPIELIPRQNISGATFHPDVNSPITSFNRRELNQILNIYGRMVAAGQWRDYAIGIHKDIAIFSIFRRASEQPLYRVTKEPKLARRQGAFAITNTAGMVLKRGRELDQVLKVLDKITLKLVE